MPPAVPLTLAQIDPVLGDLPRNVAVHVTEAARALAAGARLIVFPELSLTGYTLRDLTESLAIRVTDPPAALTPLIEAGHSISIIAGGVERGTDGGLYNAAFLFEGGEVRVVHRKVYPPTYGMFEEARYVLPGRTVRAVDTRAGRIGVLICEDLWHLSLPYLLARDNAALILALVASPTRLTGNADIPPGAAVNRENHRAYARLLSTPLLFCNRVGYEDGVNFWGGSSVIGPGGEVLAEAPLFTPHLLHAVLDPAETWRARNYSRHFLDDDPRIVLRELLRQERRKDR